MRKASPFGEWLKKWRKARLLTQVQLADKAGCAQSMISMYERGVRSEVSGQWMRPEPEFVERIATALGRPVEEGRMLAGYLASPAPATQKTVDEMMQQAESLLRNGNGLVLDPRPGQTVISSISPEAADVLAQAILRAMREAESNPSK